MDYMYWLKFLSVVIAVGLSDVCWAYYFMKVEEREPVQSGFWAVGLIVLGAFSIENYIHDSTLIIAAAIGAFVGTYLTVLYKKKK